MAYKIETFLAPIYLFVQMILAFRFLSVAPP